MKRVLFFCICVSYCARVVAQPMITGNATHVKLSDVIAAYEKTHPDFGKKDNSVMSRILPGLPKEKDEKDYQFNRWLWYWRQHLDGNGYLVSPAKTWTELKKARANERQQKSASHRGGERTTTSGLAAWTFQGPDSSGADGNGVGRINCIAFHPTNPNTYWIGAPGGGAWMTTNNGASWTSMTDSLPLLSVTQIVFNPLNPNTVYMCTGDRDGGDYPGVGILKSYNGGVTWNATGISWPESSYYTANSLLINPVDTNSLIFASTTGIQRSFDGGSTWTTSATGNFYQLLYCPGDTNIVYAASYTSGAAQGQIFRSADAGMSFTQKTSFTLTDRVSLAVSPANPAIVMAVTSFFDPNYSNPDAADNDGLSGIYNSSDTGKTFTEIYTPTGTPSTCDTFHGNLLSFNSDGTGCGGQGFYDLPIALSPTNADSVFLGGVNMVCSANGGTSWSVVNQWVDYEGPGSGTVPGVIAIHADKHFIGFNPLMPGMFFETNDGGIYSTAYPPASGGTWNNLTNGLGITEIYRTAVSNTAHYELLGAQDEGSKLVYPNSYFEADGGDGFVCHIDAVDTTIGYTSVYNGYIDLQPTINSSTLPNLPNLTQDISYNIDNGNVEGTGGWITPFVLEPSCHLCIIAAYDSVYRSPDGGNTWATISSQLITGSGYGDLLKVETTMADTNTLYVAEDGTQNIFYSHSQGMPWTSWTTITPPGSFGGTSYPNSDLKVDPSNPNHIWVTYSGYGSPQVAQWYADSGWTQMNAGLPDVPVTCFAIDYLSRDMYVGTEIGVYYRDTTMTSWAPFTSGMPSVEVTDLEINYGTNMIWAATFGRSLWSSPKHTATVLPTSVMNIVPFAPESLTISPNPNHGNFTVTTTNIPDKQVTMHITDASGKMVWKGSGMLTGSKLSVSVQGLVAGTYIFEMDADNVVEGRQKLVIY